MAEDKLDETVPGGRYIVGDQVVNAEGEVIEGLAVSKSGEIVEGKAKADKEK
jgi:hypothetical protein